MESVIDLNHVRRGVRLFRIILKRFGLSFFTMPSVGDQSRLDQDQINEIIDVIIDWLERCTGSLPSHSTLQVIEKEVTRILRTELSLLEKSSPKSFR